MGILSLSQDSIYRRLREETLLTAEEVHLLADHFGISIDELLIPNTDQVLFSYNGFGQKITSFWDYLQQLYQNVHSISQLPNLKIYYASREIPVFHFMMFPKLLTFKMYLFGLTSWHLDFLQDRPFSFELMTPQEQEMANTISKMYCAVDSTELWTSSILEQSLNQVEYMAMENRFEEHAFAFEICREIKDLLDHARTMAEHGDKSMPGRYKSSGQFDLFYNELTSTGNTILAVSDRQQVLFNTFDSPNFIYTTNQRLCTSMEEWFQKVLSHSVSISVHSAGNRNRYFNRLERRIQQTRKRLELIFSSF